MDIERELETLINKHKGKQVGLGEIRLDWFAEDCLKEVRRLKAEIARQSATSEDVGMVIKLMQAYGKNIASKCQIEGTIFHDTGSPCTRHRFEEDTIDIIITALQAYQPTISKTETTSCEWCNSGIDTASMMSADMMMRFVKPVNYCPNCGSKLTA